MFIVAITGGIATGKSTVSRVFERNGVPVVDADKIAREIVQPGKPCWKKLRDVFGDDILLPTKEIDRKKLGKMIFSDAEKRGKLNQITHPVIHRAIFIQVMKQLLSGKPWIVLDLPLLFETGLFINFMHKIITVSCESDLQLQRLMERDEYEDADARRRISSQMPLEKKCEMSHYVIENSGSIKETEADALRIYKIINSSKRHWVIRVALLGYILAIVFVGYMIKNLF